MKPKKQFISEIKDKQVLESAFILRKKNKKLTKYDKSYLELGFADKSGHIEGRLWENADEIDGRTEVGDVVRVKGVVDTFRGDKQIKVDFMEKAEDESFSHDDMVRVAEDIDGILNKIRLSLSGVKNKWIHTLADGFLNDEDFIDRFKKAPGGKSWHNAYLGGLLEHTYEVMYIVEKVCDIYPEAGRDVCVLGAFLHDIGKIYELDYKNMEYTVQGGLVGHISIGYKMLFNKVNAVPDFPGDLALRFEHIILSHHGEYEQQSPVLPKTLEATIIYQADELVSQANAIKEIQLSQQEVGKTWSNFVAIKNRKYYIRRQVEEGWADNDAKGSSGE